MLKKICASVGCNAIIPANERYCERHRNAYNREIRRKVDRRYDDFYHSREWRKMQELIMRKYHGLCVYSYIMGHEIIKADAIHHIIELRDDFNNRLNISNLIPVSAEVHSKIRQWYAEDKAKTQTVLHKCLKRWNSEFKAP
jgi:5-methylcytosine-specific restriction enzyme A